MNNMMMHLVSIFGFIDNKYYEIKMVKKHVPSCLVVIEYMNIHEMLKVFVVLM
jgi:hypothetical protein